MIDIGVVNSMYQTRDVVLQQNGSPEMLAKIFQTNCSFYQQNRSQSDLKADQCSDQDMTVCFSLSNQVIIENFDEENHNQT